MFSNNKIFILLHNYLVISTVTYSVKIYTPDTNVKNVLKLEVHINGEGYLETKRRTLVDATTTPETEVQGYAKYPTPETVFYHVSKHREGN